MLRITLKNDFHNSTTTVAVPSLPATLSVGVTKRVYHDLCGNRGCSCGGVRGIQEYVGVRLDVENEYDRDGHPMLKLTPREPIPDVPVTRPGRRALTGGSGRVSVTVPDAEYRWLQRQGNMSSTVARLVRAEMERE